ncbi:MAG: GNAT family N-acetyltransferase [Tenericutes bacterium]|nr:GNAT family N-acetyltransferase [Mycoplasmatota bacterium]
MREMSDLMSRIRIIKDEDFEYSAEIKKNLTAYNKTQSGYKEKDVRHFYIFDEDELVGACHTKQNSDWCHIKKIFYKDTDVLVALINDIKKYYINKVEGIQFSSMIEERANDFKTVGFIQEGKLKNMPENNDNVFLFEKDLKIKEVDFENDFDSKSSRKPIYQYDKKLKKEVKKIRNNLEFSTETVDIQYVVLEGDKFIGGIFANIQYEYLFINRLFVDQKYRGNQIASKLMHIVEKEAVKREISNLYLTTFEFQAAGFYKKHGYEIVMEVEDFPKGFKEYTLYKKLKKKITRKVMNKL